MRIKKIASVADVLDYIYIYIFLLQLINNARGKELSKQSSFITYTRKILVGEISPLCTCLNWCDSFGCSLPLRAACQRGKNYDHYCNNSTLHIIEQIS